MRAICGSFPASIPHKVSSLRRLSCFSISFAVSDLFSVIVPLMSAMASIRNPPVPQQPSKTISIVFDDALKLASFTMNLTTERGVKNLDVYALYSRYNKPGMPLLYFSSDTHYTAYGKSLLVDACAEMIKTVHKGN